MKNQTSKKITAAPARSHELSKEAVSRGNCYGLLALVFRDAPTADVVAQLRAEPLAEALNRLKYDVAHDLVGDLETVTERLAEEYTRIFVGPGPHVSLYASVHNPEEGQLWGESTVRVKRFVEATGLSFNDNWDSIPDHIAIELELMQKLCEREAEAQAAEDTNGARVVLRFEYKFMEEHLLKWVPAFCDKVRDAGPSLYCELSDVTKGFLLSEREYLHDLLGSELAKHREPSDSLLCGV